MWRQRRPIGEEMIDGGADLPARVTLREFDEIFEKVKNWGRWGPDDQLGTLNYMTPDSIQAAAAWSGPAARDDVIR